MSVDASERILADDPVRFAHISDSHVAADRADDPNLRRLGAMIDQIERLLERGVPIDFVVHTGDLVDDADAADARPGSTRRALAELERLALPCFLVSGNHDRRAFLFAQPSGVRIMASLGDDAGVRSARVEGLGLTFLDANPEDGAGDLHGRIGAAQLEALARALDETERDGARIERHALFLHYPPTDQGAGWTGQPEGADALRELLAERASRIVGVFAGHVHRSVHQLVDGVLYVNAPAMSRHFLLWPGQAEHADEGNGIVPWHYVDVGAHGVRIQQHAFLHPTTDGA